MDKDIEMLKEVRDGYIESGNILTEMINMLESLDEDFIGTYDENYDEKYKYLANRLCISVLKTQKLNF